MTQIVPFLTTNSTNWDELLDNPTFSSLVVPEFECADFDGTEVMEWVELQIQQVLLLNCNTVTVLQNFLPS